MLWSSERVVLLYGGHSAERQVSYDSKNAVADAMWQMGIQPIEIDVAQDLLTALREADPTRAFVCVHGRPGEDGVLQGILSYLGIPYTGSGVAASALAMDKPRSKQIWQSLDLPTAPMVVVTALEQADICLARLGQHLFVKPAHEGSSFGAFQVRSEVELIAALKTALAMDTHVLVEPMLTGRCSVTSTTKVSGQTRRTAASAIQGCCFTSLITRRNEVSKKVPANSCVSASSKVRASKYFNCP